MAFGKSLLFRGRLALTSLSIATLAAVSGIAAHADVTTITSDQFTGGVDFTTNGGPSTSEGVTVSSDPIAAGAAPNPINLSAFSNAVAAVPTGGYYGVTTTVGGTYIASPTALGQVGPPPPRGDFDFDFTFSATSGATFTAQTLGDNEIQALFIDGVAVSMDTAGRVNAGLGSYGANAPSAANFSAVISGTGTHTFDLVEFNDAGPTAVAFTATVTGTPVSSAAVPEPGMVVTGLSMLSMTGLGLVRGRRHGSKATPAA